MCLQMSQCQTLTSSAALVYSKENWIDTMTEFTQEVMGREKNLSTSSVKKSDI